MNTHLTEEQLLESLLGAKDAGAAQHIAGCPECGGQLERLCSATAALRDSARAQAEKPEGFWARQRSAAAAHRSELPARPLAWAATIAVAVLAAMLLQKPRPAVPSTPAPDPDQALLVAVERATRRQVPQALEPAALLTQEISRNVKPTGPGHQPKGESQ
ncbi:MAG: hypothetical protein ACRD2K_03955 [Terriglobales bacterium]